MSQAVFTSIGSEFGSYASQQSLSISRALNESSQEIPVKSHIGSPEISTRSKELGVKIHREGNLKLYPFTDFFKGFEKVGAVRETFGASTENVLKNLKVEFFSFRYGYMAVSDIDGHIIISTHHLKNSDFTTLYLDIIHELVHVKQFLDGKELFNSEFEYVDSPTEIEAYRHAVTEARRIGMTEKEIIEYLKVEWLNEDSHKKLVEAVLVN